MPLKGAPNVLLAPQAVVAHLRRRGAGADEPAGWPFQRHASSQLAGKELGLVETTRPDPFRVKRHRDSPRGGQALDHQPLDQQKRERGGQTPPTLVLESVDRMLDRAFVSDGRPQAR